MIVVFPDHTHLLLLSLLKIMAPWSKMRPPRGSMFVYSLYIEHIKTHSCQILKGLIFDM